MGSKADGLAEEVDAEARGATADDETAEKEGNESSKAGIVEAAGKASSKSNESAREGEPRTTTSLDESATKPDGSVSSADEEGKLAKTVSGTGSRVVRC